MHHTPLQTQEVCSTKYSVMYYKKHNTLGIRRKFGNKGQAFSFGGTRVGHSEAVLRGFADDALKKLDAGAKETWTKTWVNKAVDGKVGG